MRQLLILFFSIYFQLALCQTDGHFSMFYEGIASFNPASSGVIKEDLRVLIQYRRQWNNLSLNPYKSFQVSLDGNIKSDKKNISHIGYGFNAASDRQPNGMINNKISASIGSGVWLGKQTSLSAGINVGFSQLVINYNALNFSTQWNGSGFDNGSPSNEAFSDDRISYVDVGIGTYLSHEFENNSFYAGLAVQHAHEPQIGFFGVDEQLFRSFLLSAGGFFSINSKLGVEPHILLHNQGPNTVLTAGGNVRYILSKSSSKLDYRTNASLFAGLFARSKDGLIATIGGTYNRFTVSGAWDIVLSDLGKTSAFELSIRANLTTNGSKNGFKTK